MLRLHKRVLSAVALALLVACGLPIAVCGDTDNRPVIVLRMDDCMTSWATPFAGLGGVSGLTYGKQKHIPITWAVISGQATSGASLTWSQIKDYLDTAGGEPGSHSVTHAALLSQESYVAELAASKAAIEANLPGYQCNTFLQPGPWTNDAYMDTFAKLRNPIGVAVQSNYIQSMAYLGDGWRIGNTYYQYGTTPVYNVDAQSNPSIPALNALLDAVAATPGLVYVISGHGVQEQGKNVAYRVPADVLKALMDKLADLRDQGRVRLMSFHDACHTTFSPDLNRVPDPGFEVANVQLCQEPWKANGSAALTSPGGVDDSRFCTLADSASSVQSAFLTLPPGRYEMSWYQKVISGKQNSGLVLAVSTIDQYGVNRRNCVDWAFFRSSSAPTWERQKALFLVTNELIMTQLHFQPASNGGYGVDSVTILPAPVDPDVSPSASTVTPSPSQCTISWHTPNDPSLTTVTVRSSGSAHPTVPSSGTLVTTVPAVPGTTQQTTVPMNWTANSVYFSVFGNKPGSAYTPPDLAWIKVDKSPPAPPSVGLNIDPDGTVLAQWSSSDPDSSVPMYQYAVGTSPGDDSIRPWATTADNSATITGLRSGSGVYISAKAENAFGYWSAVGSAFIAPPATISDAVKLQDGVFVTVMGYVTAVFDGCAYLESASRSRAIRVRGNVSTLHEGDFVTLSGQLSTNHGERFVDTH